MSDIVINGTKHSGVDTIIVKTAGGGTAKYTEGERPSGTITITENGTHDVTNYATAEVNVASSGSTDSGGKYLVQVIDYDGTVLKQDHLDEGATFTLPDAPTSHERLVFQEWSSPVDITDNTVTVTDNDIIIGAVYGTKSGLSEFDITLTKDTGLSVTLNMDGTKNWGDGTSDTETFHTYTNYGDYTITCNGTTITTSSSGGLFGQKSANSYWNYYCRKVYFSNVTILGDYVLCGCYYLTDISIPNSVTSIGERFVSSGNKIKSLTIPSSVTSIGNYAFGYCYFLTNIVLPFNLTSIGNYVFSSCYSLTNIVLPFNLTSIGNYMCQYCYSLNNVNIPDGVTSVGNFAFSYCSCLKSINIPSSLANIGNSAFANTNITKYDFSSHTTIPTLASTSSFYKISITKIIVPDTLYDEWIAATNWSNYATYIYKASEMPTEE